MGKSKQMRQTGRLYFRPVAARWKAAARRIENSSISSIFGLAKLTAKTSPYIFSKFGFQLRAFASESDDEDKKTKKGEDKKEDKKEDTESKKTDEKEDQKSKKAKGSLFSRAEKLIEEAKKLEAEWEKLEKELNDFQENPGTPEQ